MMEENPGGPDSALIVALIYAIPSIGLLWLIVFWMMFGFIQGTTELSIPMIAFFMTLTLPLSTLILALLIGNQLQRIGRKTKFGAILTVSFLSLGLIQTAVGWFSLVRTPNEVHIYILCGALSVALITLLYGSKYFITTK